MVLAEVPQISRPQKRDSLNYSSLPLLLILALCGKELQKALNHQIILMNFIHI